MPDIQWEEVKAPDLSELLKEKWDSLESKLKNDTQIKEGESDNSPDANQSDLKDSIQQDSSVSEEKSKVWLQ